MQGIAKKIIFKENIFNSFFSISYKSKSTRRRVFEMKNWKRLVAMGAVVGLSINIANVSFGKQYAYTEPFDLPELTGDWRTDIIAVVESQLGYQEAEDGSTYFGAWIGEGEPTRAWCSEFVAWCAYAAKIPESVIPHKRSSNAYQKYFDQFDQFYFLEHGIIFLNL